MFLTSDLEGTGGRIRERLEDFVVDEVPLYPASGAGDHLYLTIQKAGLTTPEAIRRIARALDVPPGAVGYAGLKDARAVTRQVISVQRVSEATAVAVDVPGVQVLDARRHRNKLRLGHLKGNRFLIRIRGVGPEAEGRARAVLDRLAEVGAPNLFGEQRFGPGGRNPLVGRALVKGDPDAALAALLGTKQRGTAPLFQEEGDPRQKEACRRYDEGDYAGAAEVLPAARHAERRVLKALARGRTPERALREIPRPTLKLLVSAYQSSLFNELVTARFPDLGRLEAGDLAYLHDRGAVFAVEDPAAEQPRADALEISPSAPMFGRKVTLASGRPGEAERAALEEEGIELADFGRLPFKCTGERRPIRVALDAPSVRPDGEDAVLVSFGLPRGSFATTVLREIVK